MEVDGRRTQGAMGHRRSNAKGRGPRRGAGLGVLLALVVLATAAPAGAQGADQTCALSLTRLDHTTTNALALDTNAVYWIVGYTASPGARLRIEGTYPHARYIGFNVYDAQGRPKDAMADAEITPDAGASNPFLPGADRTVTERRYTLFVQFSDPPATPAPNTLYSGDSRGGTFWYRVYIPDQGRDAKGGVPLPRVTVEPADGQGGAPAPPGCDELQAPYLQQVNDQLNAAPGTPILPTGGFPGRNPPNWRLFVNLGKGALDIMLDNESGEAFHDPAQQFTQEGAGYFANRDISYVFAPTARSHGQVLVIRGRAPTFPETRSAPARMPSGKHMRYWSFCQYEPATQRVFSCLADDRITVDEQGFYTVVVSNAAHRPQNARAACGFAWLAWGPTTQGLLIYRHLLADRDFSGAINRIPEPGRERETLGEHYPEGRYLADAASFEREGCPAAAQSAPATADGGSPSATQRTETETAPAGIRGSRGDAGGADVASDDVFVPAGGGSLPYTGFPLLPVSLIGVALVAAGLAIRPRAASRLHD
jgi:hypothetical protein